MYTSACLLPFPQVARYVTSCHASEKLCMWWTWKLPEINTMLLAFNLTLVYFSPFFPKAWTNCVSSRIWHLLIQTCNGKTHTPCMAAALILLFEGMSFIGYCFEFFLSLSKQVPKFKTFFIVFFLLFLLYVGGGAGWLLTIIPVPGQTRNGPKGKGKLRYTHV